MLIDIYKYLFIDKSDNRYTMYIYSFNKSHNKHLFMQTIKHLVF